MMALGFQVYSNQKELFNEYRPTCSATERHCSFIYRYTVLERGANLHLEIVVYQCFSKKKLDLKNLSQK